jgi:hypothetical protein
MVYMLRDKPNFKILLKTCTVRVPYCDLGYSFPLVNIVDFSKTVWHYIVSLASIVICFVNRYDLAKNIFIKRYMLSNAISNSSLFLKGIPTFIKFSTLYFRKSIKPSGRKRKNSFVFVIKVLFVLLGTTFKLNNCMYK